MLAAILAFASFCAAQEARIVLVRSPNAEVSVDIGRAETMLRLLASELGLTGKPLPVILLIQVSRHEAALAKVDEHAPLISSQGYTTAGMIDPRQPRVYEAWLIGAPGDQKLLEMLLTVLVDHSGLPISQTDAQPILRRVLARMDSTIDVKAFATRQKGRRE